MAPEPCSVTTLRRSGEYGITNRLTAIAYVPFLVRNTVNEGVGALTGEILQPGLENTAFGDADLGLRWSDSGKAGSCSALR